MELKERIALIIKENKYKQKELAALIGVTESYISTLLSGRNQNLSASLANLIEEKLGYNAQWVLNGETPKLKQVSKNQTLSDVHKRAIMHVEKMTEEQIKAVLAFINSLTEVENSLKEASLKELSSIDSEFSEDNDIELELANYRKELEAEKKGQSASPKHAKKSIS